MQMQAPYPSARYHQAMLANAAKWLLTDAGGVLNTRDDGPGYTDLVTTATAGAFYLTKPITDFLGGPVVAGAGVISAQAMVRAISGSADGDKYFVGWSDNADPTAGGALWSAGGLWKVGALWAAMENDDAVPGGSRSSSNAAADPIARFPLTNYLGLDAQVPYAQLFNGATYVTNKGNVLAHRAFLPTHLVIGVVQAAAAVQTHRIEAGFLVYPPAPSLEVARS